MTFKLQGNELVGQPEIEWPGTAGTWTDHVDYKEHINSLPHYFVEPENLEYFKSKEVWENGEFTLQHQFKQTWVDKVYGHDITKYNWANCSKDSYDGYHSEIKRIIARPSQPVADSGKAEAIELYRGDFQAYADRLLRDRGASNADVEWAINETINELCKTYQIIKK